MDGMDVVSSPADLSASFDTTSAAADLPAGDIGTEPTSPDNENVDFDTLNAEAPGEEQEAVEEPTPDNVDNSQEEETDEPDLAAKPDSEDEELPEGVRRGQDRSGKRGLFVEPPRWNNVYSGYKTLKTLEGIAGEPVTPELFDVYTRAHIGQEKLYGDLLSGDPKAVGSVLTHFLQEGARAMQDGEVGVDPIIPLAKGFYDKLAESHPEGYAALRKQAAQDLVNEMYAEAAAANNRNLWLSTGHIAKTLGMAFKPAAEMESFAKVQTDPVRTLQQENQQLRTQLNGRSATSQAAQFDSWKTATQQATQTAVMNDAVIPALAETQAAWSKLPDGESAFNDLVRDRLHSQVQKTINDDKRFQDRIAVMRSSAARAVSAQRRQEIGEQIKQAHILRANQAIEGLKPAVVAFANKTFKEQNDAKHARRAQAATHKAPSGPGAPVKRSLVPAGMDFEHATPGNLAASLKGLFQ